MQVFEAFIKAWHKKVLESYDLHLKKIERIINGEKK